MIRITQTLKIYLKQYYREYSIVFLFFLILLLINVLPFAVFNALTYFNKVFILFLAIMITFKLKGFAPFLLALISLAIVPVMLILKENESAELLAIATYYFLAIGVTRELIDIRKESGPQQQ